MKTKYAVSLASVFCVLAAALSLSLGAVHLTLPELWAAITGGPVDTNGWIFWYARLPRTAACLLSGGALAVSGAVIQTVLHNKLASPSIIGINAGAGLAVTACCACGFLSGWTIAFASFGGALAAVVTILFMARMTGASRTTVILAGVAINSILNAVSEAITTLDPDISAMSSDFRVGGFSTVSQSRLLPAGILILLALAVLLSLCSELDVLALGEEMAQGLGLPVKKMRSIFLLLAALLAGASVSFAGLLGFVGLIVPHAVRKFCSSESRCLLPLCALGGAGFVTACDLVARLLFAPYELPVGILMAILGGPFFLLLLLKNRGRRTT